MADFFADDIFKRIFLTEKRFIFVQNITKFFRKGPTVNKSPLVQVMAWCQFGAKPLPEPMVKWFTEAHLRHQALMC